MAIFPQLSNGALAQYPLRRKNIERTLLNISEDGHVIALADTGAALTQWDLRYAGITDAEVSTLISFFESCEGNLQPFTFLDPTANLFTYSEDFSQPVWQRNTLLTFSTGTTDPFGTTRASTLTNTSAGSLSLTQTVEISGSSWCTFSAYLKSFEPITLQMTRTDGSTVRSQALTPVSTWQRFYLSSIFSSSTSGQCSFSVVFPAGAAVEVFGAQLDAQPYPATYVTAGAQSGVYANSRFNVDNLTVIATGPGQSSLNISVISKANQ